MEHWFWLSLSIGCILWYLTITGYVAYHGAKDIRSMLKNMGIKKEQYTHRV